MSNWVLIIVLGLQAHFAASYIVPLDKQAQGTFGGLLRWFWPWADGDGGPLGHVTTREGFPIAGFFLAATTALLFILAALAAAGVGVPLRWLRPLSVVGAALLVCLMALFFGPTKLIPIGVALLTLYVALARPDLFPTN
jgi:hypothetical protein